MFESGSQVRAASPSPVPVGRDARLLARAASLPPGWSAMRLLDRIDADGLSAGQALDLAACWEAQESWLLARRHAAVTAAVTASERRGPDTAGPPVPGTDAAWVARRDALDAEVAATSLVADLAGVLRVTPATAQRRIDTAAFLTAHPGLAAALAVDGCRFGHLAVLQHELTGTTHEVAAEVIRRSLPRAVTSTPARFRLHVRKALARVDADAITDRARRRARDRGCTLQPGQDLQSSLVVTGPHPMLAWAYRQFDAHARHEQTRLKARAAAGLLPPVDPHSPDPAHSSDPDTSLAALRADAVIEAARLLTAHLGTRQQPPTGQTAGTADTDASGTGTAGTSAGTGAGAAAAGPRRRGYSWTTALVLCPIGTALGLADDPGYLPGYGHIPAAIARDLAASADTWRAFLTGHGTLLDTGHTTYRPSDRLRDLITARDQTCTFPGCPVPATTADLDHAAPFNGANTHPRNLHALCRRHHRLKTHHPGWHITRDPTTGTTGWHSPTGHHYHSEPHPLWDTDPPPASARTAPVTTPPITADSPTERGLLRLLAA